jgi:hypothetical protein
MRLADATSTLTSVYDHWGKDLLTNPRYLRRGNEIVWDGSRSMWPEAIGYDELAELENRREFTFQTIDGSLLQMWYRFGRDGTTVEAASLGFISAQPDHRPEPLVPWIRIDYDPLGAAGPTHAACHMHMSLCSDLRIPIARLLTPAQFVEVIAAWFYPSIYGARRLHHETKTWLRREDLDWVHGVAAVCSPSTVERLIHLALP